MQPTDKQTETVEVMGIPVPKWVDCDRCKAILAVSFKEMVFGYDQPCNECKNTREYDEEMKQKRAEIKHEEERKALFDHAKKSQQVTSVFTIKGEPVYLNANGDIMENDDKYRAERKHGKLNQLDLKPKGLPVPKRVTKR